jgi:hypothetical protein
MPNWVGFRLPCGLLPGRYSLVVLIAQPLRSTLPKVRIWTARVFLPVGWGGSNSPCMYWYFEKVSYLSLDTQLKWERSAAVPFSDA